MGSDFAVEMVILGFLLEFQLLVHVKLISILF